MYACIKHDKWVCVCVCLWFVDLDECVEGLHECQQVCENTFGSHRCSCSLGFQLSSNGMSCTGESFVPGLRWSLCLKCLVFSHTLVQTGCLWLFKDLKFKMLHSTKSFFFSKSVELNISVCLHTSGEVTRFWSDYFNCQHTVCVKGETTKWMNLHC